MPRHGQRIALNARNFYEMVTGRDASQVQEPLKLVVGFEDGDQNLLCRIELDPTTLDIRTSFDDDDWIAPGGAIISTRSHATTEVQLTGRLLEMRFEDV